MAVSSLTLDQLMKDQTAEVIELAITGADRRRLMDLGILPGTRIEVEMRSPLGDPTAYRVRGSVIALRRRQAQNIVIRLLPNKEE
ncbi:MAG: iron transporter FeoA [Chloroflexota bacterium]|nr:MAG: iron transporter FeoA [Chloroflexota bacterium]